MTISSIINNLNYDPTITAGEIGVVIILLLTLFVVIGYTFATFGLWKQTKQQADLLISPFLNIDIDENDQFFIKNYGNSPAFNVVVDRFLMVINDLPEKPVWTVEFETIPIIGANEKIHLKEKHLDGKKANYVTLLLHLNPKYQNKETYKLSVWYRNSLGMGFITKLQTGKGGLRVVAIRPSTWLERTINWISNFIEPLLIRFLRWKPW